MGFNILAVQNAGWEHVKKLDIGLDASLFNQVNITFDYFRDYRDRILMKQCQLRKATRLLGQYALEQYRRSVEYRFRSQCQLEKTIWKRLASRLPW